MCCLIRLAAFATVVVALLGAGCGQKTAGQKTDAGFDGTNILTCMGTDAARSANGQACGCDGDCQSDFCVDGLCCNTACRDTCMACDVSDSPGICAFVPAGVAPSAASQCAESAVATCGLDGRCDGNGACRKHLAGKICKPGTCAGAAVQDVNVCDGNGRCKPGPATICAPYNCDQTTKACVETCRSNTDCAPGVTCVNGSCGPKPRGAVCTKNSDCASGFCADGVCCNVACQGACVACNQIGREGTCWPTGAGNADPHGICDAQPAATCGMTGTCDGVGGCSLFAVETVCMSPFCSQNRLITAGTCNGLGTCRMPGINNCAPFLCVTGACNSVCASDADCVPGQGCVNGSCGPKPNGQACAANDECISSFCVDGVCCAEACQGACRSCALSSSMGVCAPIPAGQNDPRNVCTDQGAASCGTDGKCDGARGCRRYAPGTVCAAERCANSVYTAAATCNATGDCVAPNTVTCAPFKCNGDRCFSGCTVDDNCVPGTVCNGNSCGKKVIGAFCGAGSECASGFCAQGVCCATTCQSACKSCALADSMGLCSDIPDGQPDPTSTCVDHGAASCGTNGKCQGGACQRYAQGTSCGAATCPAGTTTHTDQSTCDGAGSCVVPTATSCFPFRCGATTCKSTCTADADCAPPGVCGSNGSCGLKPNGGTCVDGVECSSGMCARGICCNTACTGICMSCSETGSAGTCTAIMAGGMDPGGRCVDQGASSCRTTGFCDGSGGCELYPAGTVCDGASCPIGTLTGALPRTCDGAGTCRPASTQSCLPYACNGITCNGACANDADCAPGAFCVDGSCGRKRLGLACAGGAECESGNCVDGVCCSSTTCGNCTACNVTGSPGTCRPVPTGSREPHDRCVANPPCGFDGTCDGNGMCGFAATGTSCADASCSGSSFTSAGSCDGAGTCRRTTAGCSPYVCGAAACLTACVGNLDCAVGTCQSGSCTDLASNGAGCTTNAQCISGSCTEGFCCESPACGPCQSCVLAGHEGTCSPIPAGTVCGPAACVGNSGKVAAPSTCNATGTCMPGAMTDCHPYACDVAAQACRTDCASNADCGKQITCALVSGMPGVCAAN